MDKVREHVRKELSKKVEAYGVVVWDDAAREYVDVANDIVPADVDYSLCSGSWYEVRRDVERSLAGDRPPRLLVYAPYPAPLSDPLAEIREAGGEFKLRLPTLLRNALSGELTETRIEQIGRQASTLAEAEAALASDTGADVRLISILGTSDVAQMTIRILSGDADRDIGEADLWAETAKLLSDSFGGALAGIGEQLRRAGMRHLVLTELAERVAGLPNALADMWTAPTTDQRKRALHVLGAWRRDRGLCRGYAELAAVAQSELGLESSLGWSNELIELDTVPLLDKLALEEFVRRLSSGDVGAAQDLARSRLASSMWVRERLPAPLEGAEVWEPRWRAASELARLRAEMRANPPGGGTVEEQLRHYADSGFRVDAAHRRLELALSRLEAEGVLEPLVGETRGHYERWLEDSLLSFTSAVASGGLETGDLTRQGQIHDRYVKGADGPVAYIWVDALRYEIAAELAERLKDGAENVEFTPAVAAIPTITPVGMANLCPGDDLAIELTASNRLLVKVGNTEVKGVPERENLLRAAHGDVTNLGLTELFDQGEKQLAKKIGASQLVLVRSQEMDSAGESGLLAAAWSSFETVRDLLVRAVARLAQAGVHRMVISADHGFVVLSRSLGPDRVIDAPKGGAGELHRRGWVGKGAITPANTIRIPLSDAGERSDLDLIAPRGLAVFAAGGDKRFFHGGLSPQELLVPVIVVEPKSVAAPQKLKVQVAVAGEKVTTGVFSATALFDPDLFNDVLVTRVVARRLSDKLPVARVVAGDGFDAEAGTVTLAANAQAVLTFQVIENLEAGDELEVQVLDAGTDRPLASGRAQVTVRVVVEEDLG
jgi:hypothetical protein